MGQTLFVLTGFVIPIGAVTFLIVSTVRSLRKAV